MLKKYSLLLMIGMIAACAADNKAEPADPSIIPFKTVASGFVSGITRTHEVVIQNNKEWKVFWHIHNEGKRVKLPQFNFSDNMVLAVFCGQKPSGGYTIKIEKLKMEEDFLAVYFSYHEPGSRENVTLAITQPFHMISTARYTGKIQFRYINNE